MSSESCVELIHDEKTAIWYSCYPPAIERMKELANKYPNEVKVLLDNTSADREEIGYEISFPKKWYREPRPPKKREMTEEQKTNMHEGLKKWREAGGKTGKKKRVE